MPVRPGVIPNMGDVTMATRVQIAQLGGTPRRSGTRRKTGASGRRKKKTTRKKRTRSAAPKARRAKRGRLKKGSAEAKRYMARLRKMRKR